MTLEQVLRAADVPPGHGRQLTVRGASIALFNVGGTFYATSGVCLHRGGPVGEGGLEGSVVTCPWHGWKYDVTTGTNTLNPAAVLRTYPVRVENGLVYVDV